MKYEIVIGGTSYTANVSRGTGSISVERNGKTKTFQLRETSAGFILEKDGKVFHSNLQSRQGERVWVNVNDQTVDFIWKDPYEILTGAASGAASGDIKSVMPGRVVKILVSKGQEIVANQPLLVLEAMKMENELKAPKAGKVADVLVKEGASVESGAILLTLE